MHNDEHKGHGIYDLDKIEASGKLQIDSAT